MIAGYRDGGNTPPLSAFLSGERTPRFALARSNVIYTPSYTCLHTGDSTTPLLSAQRVSPLRFVGINKHDNYRVSYVGFSAEKSKLEKSAGAMGGTDSSEAQGSSGGITPAILEQLADFQRRVVLLEGATPEAEVREAPASSPSLAPVVLGLAHPGGYFGSNRPPKFISKRDTWPLWKEKITSFTSIKGCRDAYRETPNPVRVADDSLTNEDLLC